MARKDEQPTARVQVYFENPKVEQALRREARAARIPLSRAAERAIGRGLVKRPTADPEDRLLKLERSLRDHMRSTARDMSIVQELLVELARIILLRLPDSPADDDPLHRASVELRIQRMLNEAASRISAGETVVAATDFVTDCGARASFEPRSFRAAE